MLRNKLKKIFKNGIDSEIDGMVSIAVLSLMEKDVEALLVETEKTHLLKERKQLEDFCKDVKTLMAGIGWFNVDKEEERVYTFINGHFPQLFHVEKTDSVRDMLDSEEKHRIKRLGEEK